MKEAPNNGYIALYRSLLDWEWYNDIPTRCLFIHLLLTVNFADARVHGKTIRRGQLLTSLRKLAEGTGLSIQQTRSALEHLKSTCEVTSTPGPKGTVITVKNYIKFQQATHNGTSKQHSTNTLSTHCQHTTSNKNNNIPPISPKGDEYSPAFLEFWASYPKKVGKGAAWKAFKKARPGRDLLDLMLKAVQKQKGTPSWTKEGGQYIPNPATWLNQRRWEDEMESTKGGDLDEYK